MRTFGRRFVLLHSRYEALVVTAIRDRVRLFRFRDGKIAEHWGWQEPEAPTNPSGRTQVDGPLRSLIVKIRRPIGRGTEVQGDSHVSLRSIASKVC